MSIFGAGEKYVQRVGILCGWMWITGNSIREMTMFVRKYMIYLLTSTGTSNKL